MPLGISGMGSMKDDIKKARSIAKSWTGGGNINGTIKDRNLSVPSFVIDNCYGICFLFYLKAGFVWSGGIGTGFVMTKLNRGSDQQRWSAPSAVTAGGMGWGLQIGAQKNFFVIFLNTPSSVKTFTSNAKVNMGGDVGIAAGPLGRNASVRVEAGNKGLAATYSYSYSQGLFAGIALDGTIVGANPEMNRSFYGRDIAVGALLKGREGLDAHQTVPDLAELYAYLDDALTSGGSQSTGSNLGTSAGFTSTTDNWWDSTAQARPVAAGAGASAAPSGDVFAKERTGNWGEAAPSAPVTSSFGTTAAGDSYAAGPGTGAYGGAAAYGSRVPQSTPSLPPITAGDDFHRASSARGGREEDYRYNDPYRSASVAAPRGDPYASSRPRNDPYADPYASARPRGDYADAYGSSRPRGDMYASARPGADPYASARPGADPYASARPGADPYASARPAQGQGDYYNQQSRGGHGYRELNDY